MAMLLNGIEMDGSMKYMGDDLTEGLTNYLFYPDKICYVDENTCELVPTKDYIRQ
ncbi:16322_t:CDS:1, partial [Entrophospora sp. SA101]